MDHKEAFEQLQQAGFTESQIDRLLRLRRDYVEKEMCQTPAELRRQEFIRWLILHGKLTDQVT